MTQLNQIFLLLIVFQLKHFLADYPLQGRYMLGKFRPGWDFAPPLALHCLMHAGFTWVIIGFFQRRNILWWLPWFDFTIHFLMDRIKAGPKYLGRFKDITKPYFWWALGLDQMVHHLTHYFIIWQLVR